MIAKSSAESELYGGIKGSCEGLGLAALASELGYDDMKIRVHMDASAAMGLIERKGLSKVRHIEVDVLRLQQSQA